MPKSQLVKTEVALPEVTRKMPVRRNQAPVHVDSVHIYETDPDHESRLLELEERLIRVEAEHETLRTFFMVTGLGALIILVLGVPVWSRYLASEYRNITPVERPYVR